MSASGASLACALLAGCGSAEPDVSRSAQPLIVGDDDRVLVDSTASKPYAWLAHVEAKLGNAVEVCTASLIADNRLVTVAHCIHRDGVSASSVQISLARQGDARPFGEQAAAGVTVHPRWLSDEDRAFDVAILELSEGLSPDWFSFKQVDDPSGLKVEAAGYPGDKGGGSMYRARGSIVEVDEDTARLVHDLDTTVGMSGAGVWDEHFDLLAMHVSGIPLDGRNRNFAIPFSPGLLQWLEEPCRDDCVPGETLCDEVPMRYCAILDTGCTALREASCEGATCPSEAEAALSACRGGAAGGAGGGGGAIGGSHPAERATVRPRGGGCSLGQVSSRRPMQASVFYLMFAAAALARRRSRRNDAV